MMLASFCSFFLLFSFAFANEFPFRNISLPWQQRVDDLVGRLTLKELVLQLSYGGRFPGGGPAPAIERLDILPWSWNTECLHGVDASGNATAFPQSIGLAATFSRSLVYEVVEAISKELRAKYSNKTAHGMYEDSVGLNCFSPVVNIMRHPLWGRNQETYGEDPYLSGEIAKTFVNALRGNDKRYIRATATCKHFDVHNGPEDIPVSRFSFDSKVSERDWRLTFLPQFHACTIEGGAMGVMCSYNKINGVPACANKKLLTDILRNEWNFTGFVISDAGALENIVDTHKWKRKYEDAAAAAILAGVNLDLSGNGQTNVYAHLPIALQNHAIQASDIVNAAKPLFYARMRLGEFDPPNLNPYTNYSISIIQSDKHREIATRAAMQSFVLLKNKNNVLPLSTTTYDDIAILGPMAVSVADIFGSYAPAPDTDFVTTPLKGLSSLAKNIHFANGCKDGASCNDYDHEVVKNVLQSHKHEFIIVCLGTGASIEGEGSDRRILSLPGHQNQLLQDVIEYGGGVPIILMLFNAGPVVSDLFDSVDVILEAFYPAQEAGVALRKILLNEGPNSNPAGRLPYTWLKSLDQVSEITNYSMNGFTYRYWNKKPVVFPFGYGLSYTSFNYSNLHVQNTQIHIGDDVIFSINISNVGSKDGDEVVQAYISWLDSPEPMPNIQLVGFDRIFIESGKSVKWQYTIKAQQLAVYLENKGFEVIPGKIELWVGGQQPNQTVNVGSNVLNAMLTVVK